MKEPIVNLIDTDFETIIEDMITENVVNNIICSKKYYGKPRMKWVVNRQIVNSVGNL